MQQSVIQTTGGVSESELLGTWSVEPNLDLYIKAAHQMRLAASES